MRPCVLFIPNKGELSTILSVVTFLLKRHGMGLAPDCIQRPDQLKGYMEYDEQVRLMVCDATAPGVLPVLEQLRKRNLQMRLVLLADDSISPVRYIRPGIMPSGLLWRPVDRDSTYDTLAEVFRVVPEPESEQEDQEQWYSVEVRGVVKRFPYQEILFFESRNKRLYLHHNCKEIPFNGTLERLAEELPPSFIRVHKSYIINRSNIIEIQFSQNQVLMEGGIVIPISRSYRAALKAVFS